MITKHIITLDGFRLEIVQDYCVPDSPEHFRNNMNKNKKYHFIRLDDGWLRISFKGLKAIEATISNNVLSDIRYFIEAGLL